MVEYVFYNSSDNLFQQVLYKSVKSTRSVMTVEPCSCYRLPLIKSELMDELQAHRHLRRLLLGVEMNHETLICLELHAQWSSWRS